MGVPKFYRWLSERYPQINQSVNTSLKPEFDCLYLDMNGIVHNCTHSNDPSVKTRFTETQMFQNIFKYIDKLFNIAKPKVLLYMAIDGVAPRAKMNQQRQRRFRSAMERKEAMAEAKSKGEHIEDEESQFDSNCITPGTEFMFKLSNHLRYFVQKKVKEDASWQKLTIIFSGAEVPGEGEHKIMMYIRQMKMQPHYQPNLRHCLYGLDADLIMLSLVSHEPHFALLREEVIFGSNRGENLPRRALAKLDEFQFLHTSLLREYLDVEYRSLNLSFYDLERVVDDIVFLCFFVGNDFLPHLPTLDIGESGLDNLFAIYKELLPRMGGYLTECGVIDWSRAEQVLARVGGLEEGVFAMREQERRQFDRRRRKPREKAQEIFDLDEEDEEKKADEADTAELDRKIQDMRLTEQARMRQESANSSTQSFQTRYYKEKFAEFFAEDARPPDMPKELDSKFGAECVRILCRTFMEGLSWVMAYYYQGVSSWTWFFPFRYAPLASDMVKLSELAREIRLVKGAPFKPLEQLLGVLPPLSAKLLPAPFRRLMLEPTSPVIAFYPPTFKVDMNGKKNPWEGIALIPFIDEGALLKAVASVDTRHLSESERTRNEYGHDWAYTFDPTVLDTVPSSFAKEFQQLFPPVSESQCAVRTWVLPEYPDEKGFRPALCGGVQLPCPGYPHLRSLGLLGQLRKVGVNVFGRDSTKESMVLQVLNADLSDGRAFAAKYVSRRCWVDWPYLKEGLVVAVTDGKTRWERAGNVAKAQPLTQQQCDQWTKDFQHFQIKLLSSRAVDCGAVQVMAEVRPFEGMRRIPDGSIRKWYGNKTVNVPAQLLLPRNANPDPRFDEIAAPSIQDAFPLNSPIVYIGSDIYYGSLGEVIAHNTASQTLAVRLWASPDQLINFGRETATNSALRYFPAYMVARKLGLNGLVLSKVCSSIFVNPGQADLGLKIKASKQSMQVAEYARRVDAWRDTGDESAAHNSGGSWEYSELTVSLLEKYVKRFPEFFDYLNSNPETYKYDAENFSAKPGKMAALAIVGEMKAWLDEQQIAGLMLVPCTSNVLPSRGVKILESEAARYREMVESLKKTEVVLQNVPLFFAYRPSPVVPWSPTERDAPNLGDRVLSLRSDLGVPFGLHGTVVAVHDKFGEVVFDKEFIAGNDLHGRCTNMRGYTLPLTSLLNMSAPHTLVPKSAQHSLPHVKVVSLKQGDPIPEFHAVQSYTFAKPAKISSRSQSESRPAHAAATHSQSHNSNQSSQPIHPHGQQHGHHQNSNPREHGTSNSNSRRNGRNSTPSNPTGPGAAVTLLRSSLSSQPQSQSQSQSQPLLLAQPPTQDLPQERRQIKQRHHPSRSQQPAFQPSPPESSSVPAAPSESARSHAKSVPGTSKPQSSRPQTHGQAGQEVGGEDELTDFWKQLQQQPELTNTEAQPSATRSGSASKRPGSRTAYVPAGSPSTETVAAQTLLRQMLRIDETKDKGSGQSSPAAPPAQPGQPTPPVAVPPAQLATSTSSHFGNNARLLTGAPRDHPAVATSASVPQYYNGARSHHPGGGMSAMPMAQQRPMHHMPPPMQMPTLMPMAPMPMPSAAMPGQPYAAMPFPVAAAPAGRSQFARPNFNQYAHQYDVR